MIGTCNLTFNLTTKVSFCEFERSTRLPNQINHYQNVKRGDNSVLLCI